MEIVQAIDNPNEKFTQTMAEANVCSQYLVLLEKNRVLQNKTIDLKNKLGKEKLNLKNLQQSEWFSAVLKRRKYLNEYNLYNCICCLCYKIQFIIDYVEKTRLCNYVSLIFLYLILFRSSNPWNVCFVWIEWEKILAARTVKN